MGSFGLQHFNPTLLIFRYNCEIAYFTFKTTQLKKWIFFIKFSNIFLLNWPIYFLEIAQLVKSSLKIFHFVQPSFQSCPIDQIIMYNLSNWTTHQIKSPNWSTTNLKWSNQPTHDFKTVEFALHPRFKQNYLFHV